MGGDEEQAVEHDRIPGSEAHASAGDCDDAGGACAAHVREEVQRL